MLVSQHLIFHKKLFQSVEILATIHSCSLLATSDEMASCPLISRALPPPGAPAAAGQLELGLAEEPC